MSSLHRWKVTNITIKPLKYDQRGHDVRSIRDRVGHAVEFPNGKVEAGKAQLVVLYQTKSVIVDEINDAILKLHSRHYVSVEKIEDITDELKKYAFTKEEKPAKDKKETSQPEAGMSSPMGETREDDAVNPDGEPNFVAKAPRGGLSKTKR